MIHLTEETIILKNGRIRKKPKKVNLIYHSFDEMKEHKREILELLNEKDDGYEILKKTLISDLPNHPKKQRNENKNK